LEEANKNSTCYLFILERMQEKYDSGFSQTFKGFEINRREVEIIKLLLQDRSNKEMAQALGLSINTIKGYLVLLMRKLGVSSRGGIHHQIPSYLPTKSFVTNTALLTW